MSKRQVILRADDAGSSTSANQGILKVVNGGLVKNVSLMAVGPKIIEASQLFKGRDDVCFGVHLVLNAEWDRVKWGPLTKLDQSSGLIDEEGYFLSNPELFIKSRPAIDLIMAEYQAQYDYLLALGFKITYADSHMMAELKIPGLQAAVDLWTAKLGLLNHADYYSVPPKFEQLINREVKTMDYLKSVPSGQYFYVIHPALDSAEMRLTGNQEISGDKVAVDRNKEAQFFSKKIVKLTLKGLDIETIRYDQAQKQKRMTLGELM